MEYLGWWIEELEERNKTGSFVCDNFSFIVPRSECSQLRVIFYWFVCCFFLSRVKRSCFSFFKTGAMTLQHTCSSTGPPALGKAGSSVSEYLEGKRRLKYCEGLCQLPLFLQWLPYQQCVGYQRACVHQTGLHSTLEFPTAFCSFDSMVLVKACSAVSFLTPIWATRQFN